MDSKTLWIVAGAAAVLLWLHMRNLASTASPAAAGVTTTPPVSPEPLPNYVNPLLARAGTFTPTLPAYQPPIVPPAAPSHTLPVIGIPTRPIRQAVLSRALQSSDQAAIGF